MNVIENLDRPGGHIIVCLVIMFFGAYCAWIGLMDNLGRDLVVGASSVIFAAMTGTGKASETGSTKIEVTSSPAKEPNA